MTIGVMSLFRNSQGYLGRYFAQIDALHAALKERGDSLELFLVYGDCTDDTLRQLQAACFKRKVDFHLVPAHHHGPVYGSTERPDRLKALSFVFNEGLMSISGTVDMLLYVESDLIWDPSTWLNLLPMLEPGYDVLAPLIFCGKHFYDTWAYRNLDGSRFNRVWSGRETGDELFEVGSVGSGFVMRGEVARTCRSVGDQALVGFFDDVRAKGYRIWVDPTERITHPV